MRKICVALTSAALAVALGQSAGAEQLSGIIRVAHNDRPISNAKVILRNSYGQKVVSATTNQRGKYNVVLDPGEYVIIVFSPKRGTQILEQTIFVERGIPTEMNFEVGPRRSLWGQALRPSFM